MKIKCDIEKSKSTIKDIDLNIERYKEIVDNFYDIVESFNAHGWLGKSAYDYANYLGKKKRDFDVMYVTLKEFVKTAQKNVYELENTVKASKVSGNE